MKDHPRASFRLYERLNHPFGDYQGERPPFSQIVIQEYQQATPPSLNMLLRILAKG